MRLYKYTIEKNQIYRRSDYLYGWSLLFVDSINLLHIDALFQLYIATLYIRVYFPFFRIVICIDLSKISVVGRLTQSVSPGF